MYNGGVNCRRLANEQGLQEFFDFLMQINPKQVQVWALAEGDLFLSFESKISYSLNFILMMGF